MASSATAVNPLHSSESTEWYTPAKYIESARAVMGGIDLDPASCVEANKTVNAARYYDVEANGLSKPWGGCVWLNPPYKRGITAQWLRKLLSEMQSERVLAAVVLVNATPDRRWFAPIMMTPRCWVDHRIRFVKPGGKPGPSPTHASVFALFRQPYVAEIMDARFEAEFSQHGYVVI